MADFTRTQNETATAADSGIRAQQASKSQDETVTAADSGIRAQQASKSQDETATAADGLTSAQGFLRSSGETATAVDGATPLSGKTYRSDETVTATDVVRQADFSERVLADTATAVDGVSVSQGFLRRGDETATAVDVVIQEDNSRRRVVENVFVVDGVTVGKSTAYSMSEGEVLYASDDADQIPDNAWLPKKVYVRHLNKQVHKPGVPAFSAAVAIQYRDWSNSRTSGLLRPTGRFDGNTPVFRNGAVTEFLAEVFASWTSAPKGIIAHHMNRGELAVWEDYLGTTRQLTSGQVLQYDMNTDQPWATWITHRGPLTVADTGGPTVNDGGTLAVDFKNLLVRPIFTAGTSPTVDIQVWAREATQPRGTWVAVGTTSSLSGQVSYQVDYREAYVEVTAIGGSPTNVTIELSGTAA